MAKVIKILCVIFIFIYQSAYPQVDNKILVKVDNKIITNYDLVRETRTLLLINNIEFNNDNYVKIKTIALNGLIDRSLKLSEIEKYEIEKFNKLELSSYIDNLAKSQNITVLELKKKFVNNNLNYDTFIENLKVGYIWNSLIFDLYKNQIEINTIEIENELEQIVNTGKTLQKFNISEIEISSENISEKKMVEIYKFINKFGYEEAVKKFSTSESSLNNGKLGWISENELQNVYRRELKKLKVGEITQPIKKNNKLIILKLNDKETEQKIVENVEELRKKLINQKKNKKLNLFSKSHLSQLERTVLVEKYE